MSEARFDKIASRLGTRPPAVEKADFVKVWCNYDQITPAIRDSIGLSSVADVGIGKYTLRFATVFATGNYSVVAMTNAASDTSNPFSCETSGPITANEVNLTNKAGTTLIDRAYSYSQVCGALA